VTANEIIYIFVSSFPGFIYLDPKLSFPAEFPIKLNFNYGRKSGFSIIMISAVPISSKLYNNKLFTVWVVVVTATLIDGGVSREEESDLVGEVASKDKVELIEEVSDDLIIEDDEVAKIGGAVFTKVENCWEFVAWSATVVSEISDDNPTSEDAEVGIFSASAVVSSLAVWEVFSPSDPKKYEFKER